MSNFTPRNPHNRRQGAGTPENHCDPSEHDENCPNHPRNQQRPPQRHPRCPHVTERRNATSNQRPSQPAASQRPSQPIASATYKENSIEGILRSQPTFPPKYTESLMNRLEEAYWDNWKPPKPTTRWGLATGREPRSLWGPQVRRAPPPPPRHELHSRHEPRFRHEPHSSREPHSRHEPHSSREPHSRHEPHSCQEPHARHDPHSHHEPHSCHEPNSHHEPHCHHDHRCHHHSQPGNQSQRQTCCQPQSSQKPQTRREPEKKEIEKPRQGQKTEVTYYAGSKFQPSSMEGSDLNTDGEQYQLVEMSSRKIQTDDTPPVIDDTPPVVDDTPPVVDDTPPVVDDTPPVVDDIPPVVDNTPSVVDDHLTETEAEVEMKVINETKDRHKKVIEELKVVLPQRIKVESAESTSVEESVDEAGPSNQSREDRSESRSSTQQLALRLTRRSTGYLRGGTYPPQSNKKDNKPISNSFRLGPPGGTLFMTSYSYNKKYNK